MVFATDYYPFGMAMPERSFDSPKYRYGFNGKEKDESGEWGSLTHYDYGFRIYNPGIARFLSVDPLSMNYPWLTPYQYASLDPITNIDVDGLEGDDVKFRIQMRARGGIQKEAADYNQKRVNEAADQVMGAIVNNHKLGLRYVALAQVAEQSGEDVSMLQKSALYIAPWFYRTDVEGLTGANYVEDLLDENASAGTKVMAGFMLIVEITPLDEIVDIAKLGKRSGRRTKISPNDDLATSRSLRRENESADILAGRGFDVEQNPLVSGPKKPDFKINGNIYDNYAPETANARNIWDTVRGKVNSGQTSNVVINLKDSSVDFSKLEKQFKEYPIEGLGEIIIIK